MQIHQVLSKIMSVEDPTLYHLVNNIIHEAAPLAVHHRNYVVNNVPADLCIETNGAMVSSVLSKLFQTVVRNVQNSVILVSAKVYGMSVLIQIKSKGVVSPGLAEEIGHASIRAQNTGGIIEIIQCEAGQASVAYCFLNVAAA